MTKGIKRKLDRVRDKVQREISAMARRDRIAGALSGEGYAGGYRDALDDVMLALNGGTPRRRGWWTE